MASFDREFLLSNDAELRDSMEEAQRILANLFDQYTISDEDSTLLNLAASAGVPAILREIELRGMLGVAQMLWAHMVGAYLLGKSKAATVPVFYYQEEE